MSDAQPKRASIFGARLRARRQALGLSQEKVGVSIGLDESCSRTRISRYETGAHEPAIATSLLLATALGVPLAYLYCEDDILAEIIRLTDKLELNAKQIFLECIQRSVNTHLT
jgi:transcriptional regulator with XRE-family HTH domain